MKPEMTGCQWHQLDHIQINCTSLQTDNYASTSSSNFLRTRCCSWRPTNSVKALKAPILCIIRCLTNLFFQVQPQLYTPPVSKQQHPSSEWHKQSLLTTQVDCELKAAAVKYGQVVEQNWLIHRCQLKLYRPEHDQSNSRYVTTIVLLKFKYRQIPIMTSLWASVITQCTLFLNFYQHGPRLSAGLVGKSVSGSACALRLVSLIGKKDWRYRL